MAQIIQLDFNKTNSASGVIDIATVQQSCRKLKAGLIAPATEEVHTDLAVEHAAEPIKSMDDIIRISQFLIGQKRFRDNMLFIVGINFGLRISDLRSLRFTHIINDDCTFRDRFPILEKRPGTRVSISATATSPLTPQLSKLSPCTLRTLQTFASVTICSAASPIME